jgi:hypothetical protein
VTVHATSCYLVDGGSHEPCPETRARSIAASELPRGLIAAVSALPTRAKGTRIPRTGQVQDLGALR